MVGFAGSLISFFFLYSCFSLNIII
jgi:hypothetical protein